MTKDRKPSSCVLAQKYHMYRSTSQRHRVHFRIRGRSAYRRLRDRSMIWLIPMSHLARKALEGVIWIAENGSEADASKASFLCTAWTINFSAVFAVRRFVEAETRNEEETISYSRGRRSNLSLLPPRRIGSNVTRSDLPDSLPETIREIAHMIRSPCVSIQNWQSSSFADRD